MTRTPINRGLLQSHIDFAGFKPLNADLSDYVTPPGPSGGGIPGVFVNVKDTPYNAQGDDATDDTAAINQAISDVIAAGGGKVFFPHGIYLCNGAFDPTFKSILKIPVINGGAASSVTLEILGEGLPTWNVAGGAVNYMHASTIKTTRSDGMTADASGNAAIIAGNSPKGNVLVPDFSTMNAVLVKIKNMAFLCPDNPTMGGIRLDGVAWATVEDVVVCGGLAVNSVGATEPTHGTTAVWMPNSINWSISWANRVTVNGFDTGFKIGEHFRGPMIQAFGCKNGVSFLEAMYPSWANIQLFNCAEGIRFLGYHTVDLLVETEHSPAGDWMAAAHDIKDPSNYGMGIIRYYIGHGTASLPSIGAAVDGGTGLTLVDLCSGSIGLNNTQGASGGAGMLVGKVFATRLLVGYTDTGLDRNNAGILEVNNGTAGTFRELLARSVKHNAVVFAGLPASPSIGQVAAVNDAAAGLAWGAPVTVGGSTASYLVWWNGTNWTVLGK